MFCKSMRTFIVAVAAMTIATVSVSLADAKIPLPRPRPLIVTFDSFRNCLAAIVYTESRGESKSGQLQVGFVARQRALLNLPGFGGPTMCGVALAPGQFDGIKGTAFVPGDKVAWAGSLNVVDEIVEERFVPQGEMRYATHYLVLETSSLGGRCWFERNLKPIDWLDKHLFYREPLHYETPRPSIDCAPKKGAVHVARR